MPDAPVVGTAGGRPVSAGAVRRVVVAVCVAGVAGLVVTSVLDRTGAAVTIGLVTAVAVLCLIVATAVGREGQGTPEATADEAQAAQVEAGIGRLVADGADEAQVRALVADAVRLGRRRPPAG